MGLVDFVAEVGVARDRLVCGVDEDLRQRCLSEVLLITFGVRALEL